MIALNFYRESFGRVGSVWACKLYCLRAEWFSQDSKRTLAWYIAYNDAVLFPFCCCHRIPIEKACGKEARPSVELAISSGASFYAPPSSQVVDWFRISSDEAAWIRRRVKKRTETINHYYSSCVVAKLTRRRVTKRSETLIHHYPPSW